MNHEIILLVEDEQDIQDLLKFHLEQADFSMVSASTGEEALRSVKAHKPDLVLLDLMLPGMDGLEVCRRLRTHPETRDIPIVMLTAKDSEADIITGLEMGASDYVTKPFSPGVLVARLQAVLRRPESGAGDEGVAAGLRIGPIAIDPDRLKVTIRKKPIPLTLTEFRILQLLAENAGRPFSRHQIVEHVRGDSYNVTERIVDVQMVSLRKKLGNWGDWVETVRGIGYRFREV